MDNYCLWCGRSLKYEGSFAEAFWQPDCLCADCRRQLPKQTCRIRLDGLKVESLYVYEKTVRQLLLQYKDSRDEALFPVLLWPQAQSLHKKYKNRLIVPVPSSAEAVKRRGFVPIEQMWQPVGLRLTRLLVKTDDYVQKGRPAGLRRQIADHIRLNDALPAAAEVLLVDDIITTGASLQACYRLLQPHYRHIEAFTIAYSRRYLPKWRRCLNDLTGGFQNEQ